MASSFIDYRGHGFWARDAQAEVWLYLLCTEVGAMADSPGWLEEARDDWSMQATAGFIGCVSPSLDRHLGGDLDRVATVLALSEQIRQRLVEWAPAIPKDMANGFGTGGDGSYFTTDVDTADLLRFADAFIDLLRECPGSWSSYSPS